MRLKNVFLVFILFLVSCSSEMQDIYGTWTSENIEDPAELGISDRMLFEKDGSYTFELVKANDTLVRRYEGVYSLDKEKGLLTITADGQSFTHEVLWVKENNMKVCTDQGQVMKLRRME